MMPFVHGYGVFAWREAFTRTGWHWIELHIILGMLAIGSTLTRPPAFGLTSILTPSHEQGETNAVAQSASSRARITRPIFDARLSDYAPAIPYLSCSAVCLIAACITWQRLCKPEHLILPGSAESASSGQAGI